MRPLKAVLAITLFLQGGLVSVVCAQTGSTSDADSTAIQEQVGSGDITRPAAGAVGGIQLSASTNSNQASLNVGTAHPNSANWSVLLSSPISMGSSSNGGSSATNTNIATLDGLANGFAATLKLSRFQFLKVAAGDEKTDAMVSKALTSCLGSATSQAAKDTCNHLAPGALINRYDSADMQAYLSEHFPTVKSLTAYTYGMQAAVGYNSFTYYQPPNLDKSLQKEIPRSIGAHLGLIPSMFHAPTLVNLAVNYQQAYMAAPSSTQCNSRAMAIKCQTGSIGPPKRTDKVLLSLDGNTELRMFGQFVGLGPQITFDPKNKQEGVDLPMYFIPDSKGNLIGGVTAGWTNTQHFTIGLIVGAPFAFFTQSK